MKSIYVLKILLSGLILVSNSTQSIQKEYYESGNLSAEGRMVDGLREGVWKGYYETGELQGEMVFSKGVVDGPIIAYHKNGNIQTKGQYREGKKEGIMESYYADGSLYAKMNFRNNEYHGKYELFYPNGTLWETGSYLNGRKKGTIRTFKENGELLYEKKYNGDEPTLTEIIEKKLIESANKIITQEDDVDLLTSPSEQEIQRLNGNTNWFRKVWNFLNDNPITNALRWWYDAQYNPLYWPLLCIPLILILFFKRIIEYFKKIFKK